MPADYQSPRRIYLQDFARVQQAPVRMGHFPGGALLPVALDGRVEPVLADELRIRQRLPKLAGRRADVRDVDEAASVCWVHCVLRMGVFACPSPGV